MIDIIKTCSFTGYRPEKLPFGYDEDSSLCKKLKAILRNEIETLILQGCEHFITGMALGVDMICGELMLELKQNYPNVKITAAVPCYGQEKHWGSDTQCRYNNLITAVDNVVFVSKTGYYNGCMQKRNRYLVDNCDLLLAVFDGKAGGTMKTVEYAKKQSRRLVVIDPTLLIKIHLVENTEQVEQLQF